MITLRNENGMVAQILPQGAILHSLFVPNKDGRAEDVVLGFESLEDYKENPPYLGATVGRFGNRIAGGRFSIDGIDYQLPCNNDPGGIESHLHGGLEGFDKKTFVAEFFKTEDAESVCLCYHSPDGEEGYPGELSLEVTYTLTQENELVWEAKATTTAPTIINIVNHTYWNLGGDLSKTVLDHEIQIESDSYLPSNEGLIPLGEPATIEGTPLDFRSFKSMGADIKSDFPALVNARGYDQAFVLSNAGETKPAATVKHSDSGRTLVVSTNQPAVHFYTGNFVGPEPVGKYGQIYGPHCGFCLETENWPDAPNNPKAPDSVLRPGETYHHVMRCKFSW